MTQAQLATELRIAQTTVSEVELGQAPTLPFLYALAQAYELDENVLRAQAGLTTEPMPANEQARAELLAIFDRLDDEDQVRVIEHAKAVRTATQKLRGQARSGRRHSAT